MSSIASSLTVMGGRTFAAIPAVFSIQVGGAGGGQSGSPAKLGFGTFEDLSDGDPASPSMGMWFPTQFSFRWVVNPGTHTIQVNVKQDINISPRPSMIVKANSSIGVNSDVSASAPSNTGWCVIGPITVTATAQGILIVELASNITAIDADPCLWGQIVVT